MLCLGNGNISADDLRVLAGARKLKEIRIGKPGVNESYPAGEPGMADDDEAVRAAPASGAEDRGELGLNRW